MADLSGYIGGLLNNLKSGVQSFTQPLAPPVNVIQNIPQQQLHQQNVLNALRQTAPVMQQAQQAYQQNQVSPALQNLDLPKFNFAQTATAGIKNPFLRYPAQFALSLPEMYLNAPVKVAEGSLGIGAAAGDLLSGKRADPRNTIANAAKMGEGFLTAYTPGAAANVAEDAFKLGANNSIFDIGKTLAQTFNASGKAAAPIMGAFGGLQALENNRNQPNSAYQIANSVIPTIAGAALGYILGGSIGVGATVLGTPFNPSQARDEQGKFSGSQSSQRGAINFGEIYDHAVQIFKSTFNRDPTDQEQSALQAEVTKQLEASQQGSAPAGVELPQSGSIEQLTEQNGGFQPGQRQAFDEALMHGDKQTVQDMLPKMPQEYVQGLADQIEKKTGITLPNIPGSASDVPAGAGTTPGTLPPGLPQGVPQSLPSDINASLPSTNTPPVENGSGKLPEVPNPDQFRKDYVSVYQTLVSNKNQIANAVEKALPDKADQEALYLYRDTFKNNPIAVQQAADLLAQGDKSLTPYADVIQRAMNPSPEIVATEQNIVDPYFANRAKVGTDAGYIKNNLPDYLTHIIQQGESAGDIGTFPAKGMSRSTPYGQGRVYTNVLDAIMAGEKPATMNTADVIRIYGEKDALAAATNDFISTAQNAGVGKWFTPSDVPEGWTRLDPYSRRFENSLAINDSEGAAQKLTQVFAVPDELATAMKPVTEPDWLKKVGGIGKWRMAQNWAKFMNVSLSPMHAWSLTKAAAASDPIAAGKAVLMDLNAPDTLGIENDLIQHGGTTPVLSGEYDAFKSLQPESTNPLINNPVTRGFNTLENKIVDNTFGGGIDGAQLLRRYKISDYATKMATWMAKNPDATEAEVNTAKSGFANYVNNTYGGLNWESIGVTKSTLTGLRTLMFAPDWTFSNFKNLSDAATGQVPKGAVAKFAVTGALLTTALTELTTKLLTGKFSGDPFNVTLGYRKDGTEIKANIFSTGAQKDVINLATKIGEHGPGGILDFVSGKLAPGLNTAAEELHNQDYYGNPIRNPGKGLVGNTIATAEHIGSAVLPFNVQSLYKSATGKTPGLPSEFAVGALGLGTLSKSAPSQDAYKTAYNDAIGRGKSDLSAQLQGLNAEKTVSDLSSYLQGQGQSGADINPQLHQQALLDQQQRTTLDSAQQQIDGGADPKPIVVDLLKQGVITQAQATNMLKAALIPTAVQNQITQKQQAGRVIKLQARQQNAPLTAAQPGFLDQAKSVLFGSAPLPQIGTPAHAAAPMNGTYVTNDGKLIDLSPATSLPEGTLTEKAIKQEAVWKKVNDISSADMSPADKQAAYKELGVDPTQASYYDMATNSEAVRTANITEMLQGVAPKDVIPTLTQARTSVNGKQILTDPIVTQLVNAGTISKSDGKYLKSITDVKDGVTKLKPSGLSTRKPRKLSITLRNPPAAPRIAAMKMPKIRSPRLPTIKAPRAVARQKLSALVKPQSFKPVKLKKYAISRRAR